MVLDPVLYRSFKDRSHYCAKEKKSGKKFPGQIRDDAQKYIYSWSLKLIFCSFEVLMSTSKLQNMKSKLQLDILFNCLHYLVDLRIPSWLLG